MKLKNLFNLYQFDSSDVVVNIHVNDIDRFYVLLCNAKELSYCNAIISKTENSVALFFYCIYDFELLRDYIGDFCISKIGINQLNDLLVEVYC